MNHDRLTKELFEKWKKVQNRKDIPIKKLIKENALGDINPNDAASMPSSSPTTMAKPIPGAIAISQDLGDSLIVNLSGLKNDYEEYGELPNAVEYKGKKYYKASFNSDKHYVVYKLGDKFAVAIPESALPQQPASVIRSNQLPPQELESLINSAVEQLVTTYDFDPDMNTSEVIGDFEADNNIIFTPQHKKEIIRRFNSQWNSFRQQAGVKKPVRPDERARIYRAFEEE